MERIHKPGSRRSGADSARPAAGRERLAARADAVRRKAAAPSHDELQARAHLLGHRPPRLEPRREGGERQAGPRGRSAAGVLQRRLPTGPQLDDLTRESWDIPASGDLLATVISDAPNLAAHTRGLRTLVERQLAEIRAQDAADGGTRVAQIEARYPADIAAQAPALQWKARADAIRAIIPESTLGDPALIKAPPASAAELANVQTLVTNANAVFDAVAAGARNADIDQVFGGAQRAAAVAKFALARTAMNAIHLNRRILSDRSGWARQVNVAGLTEFDRQIFLEAGVIDAPNAAESVVTMVHESLHAGNADVVDRGYLGSPNFKELPAATKLINAAHFEVIARRMLQGDDIRWNGDFVPAGGGGGAAAAAAAPALTPTQTAMGEASERLRRAWTTGLWLHDFFVWAHLHPESWTTDLGGGRNYRDSLPFWSKVENLTVHLKTDVDVRAAAAGPGVYRDPARQPVSLVDVALSESVTRRLNAAMNLVPTTVEGAVAALNRGLTLQQILDMSAPAGFIERATRKLMREALSTVALSADPDRDVRTAQAMSETDFAGITTTRNPDTFAD